MRGDRKLLVFDPQRDGLIVEVFGDLAAAAHLAVLVPGVGNALADYEANFRSNAARLYARLRGSDAAVVAWLGYDTPDHLAAAAVSAATDAARPLARFLDGIRGPGPVHTSLIGHSYGSAVVGRALADGLEVDEAVFIGSPGVGVDRVSDLDLPAGTRVWAGRAPADPIRFARAIECIEMTPVCYPSTDRPFFGTYPVEPSFGAIRFPVGNPPLEEAHSSYFADGLVSLRNLAFIITGREDRLDNPAHRFTPLSE